MSSPSVRRSSPSRAMMTIAGTSSTLNLIP
jgi:hypothetical protein